uniref:Uncharacterized protein n=1 Tax=Cacopsylla melanoneura TaxID=428564 RepID=A0A8D8W7W1_9HEMI
MVLASVLNTAPMAQSIIVVCGFVSALVFSIRSAEAGYLVAAVSTSDVTVGSSLHVGQSNILATSIGMSNIVSILGAQIAMIKPISICVSPCSIASVTISINSLNPIVRQSICSIVIRPCVRSIYTPYSRGVDQWRPYRLKLGILPSHDCV